MTQASRAALLSAFLFPGSGQFLLKRPLRGLSFLLPAGGALAVLVHTAVNNALSILARIDVQGTIPDIQALSEMAVQASASDAPVYRAGLAVFLACWLLSIVDAYRLGAREPSA